MNVIKKKKRKKKEKKELKLKKNKKKQKTIEPMTFQILLGCSNYHRVMGPSHGEQVTGFGVATGLCFKQQTD